MPAAGTHFPRIVFLLFLHAIDLLAQLLHDFGGDGGDAFVVEVAGPRELHVDDLFDAARARGHEHDAVAQTHRLADVVRYEDDGFLRSEPHPLELFVERLARLRVEGGERLVHEQRAGLADQSASQGTPLPHPSREGVDAGVGKLVEVHETEGLLHALVRLRARHARELQREGDVGAERQPGEKRRILEHHGAVRTRSSDTLAADEDLAARDAVQARDQVQERGFPAAGRAEEAHELPRLHLEIHVDDPGAASRDGATWVRLARAQEALLDAAEGDGCSLGRRRSGGPCKGRRGHQVGRTRAARRRRSSALATRPPMAGEAGR